MGSSSRGNSFGFFLLKFLNANKIRCLVDAVAPRPLPPPLAASRNGMPYEPASASRTRTAAADAVRCKPSYEPLHRNQHYEGLPSSAMHTTSLSPSHARACTLCRGTRAGKGVGMYGGKVGEGGGHPGTAQFCESFGPLSPSLSYTVKCISGAWNWAGQAQFLWRRSRASLCVKYSRRLRPSYRGPQQRARDKKPYGVMKAVFSTVPGIGERFGDDYIVGRWSGIKRWELA